jgi:hypothetical protein
MTATSEDQAISRGAGTKFCFYCGMKTKIARVWNHAHPREATYCTKDDPLGTGTIVGLSYGSYFQNSELRQRSPMRCNDV